jgi:accessory gene regulator protein AgrB
MKAFDKQIMLVNIIFILLLFMKNNYRYLSTFKVISLNPIFLGKSKKKYNY